MLELDRLIDECRQAAAAQDAASAVRAVIARAVSNPADALAAFRNEKPGLHSLFRSDTLTLLNVIWAPGMTIGPHDHNMWAVIGLYAGCEENTFWRADALGRMQAVGTATLRAGEVRMLGREVVHSVNNPLDRMTGALHAYGGDFFRPDGRSEWEGNPLDRQPWDPARAARRFTDAGDGAVLRW